jgi:hypothetical protein
MELTTAMYVDFGPDNYYRIYKDGRLFCNHRGVFLKDTRNSNGYIINQFKHMEQKMYRHRLVATHFVVNPRPDIFTHIDHINGIKTDNRASNLRFCTNGINLLNQKTKSIKADPRATIRPFQSRLTFLKQFFHLAMCPTEESAIKLNDRIRRLLCKKFYEFTIRPMAYAAPQNWKISQKGVVTRPLL